MSIGIGQVGPSGSTGGSGDVVGPASATSGHLAVFSGPTGKVIADGGAIPGGISGLTTNTLPKATSATTLGNSQVTDTGTVFSVNVGLQSGSLYIDSFNGIAQIEGGNTSVLYLDGAQSVLGDKEGNGNGTTLTVDDGAGTIAVTGLLQLGGNGIEQTSGISPGSAGSADIGTAALPYKDVFIGNAANNSAQLTGVFTGNRIVTFPDATITIPANFGAPLSCLVSNTTLASATGTVYTSPGYGGTPLAAATEAAVGWACPRAGTISALQVYTGTTAKVNTPATVITVRKAGVDTTLTLTLTQTVSTLSADNTHSFTVARGDIITVSVTTTGAAGVSTSIAGISFLLN